MCAAINLLLVKHISNIICDPSLLFSHTRPPRRPLPWLLCALCALRSSSWVECMQNTSTTLQPHLLRRLACNNCDKRRCHATARVYLPAPHPSNALPRLRAHRLEPEAYCPHDVSRRGARGHRRSRVKIPEGSSSTTPPARARRWPDTERALRRSASRRCAPSH